MVGSKSTIDHEQIDGAFALAVDVRFTDLSSGAGQKIFDLASSNQSDSIWLGQLGDSNDIEFVIVNSGVEHRLVAADAIVQGEYATFRVSVDPLGTMRIAKNTDLLVEAANGPGAVPADVDRDCNIGMSSNPSDAELSGIVLNMKIANYGDVGALDPTGSESPCAITGEAKCLCDKLLPDTQFVGGDDGPAFVPTFDAEGDGEFSTVQSLGSIPVHAMLMPDGKILSFGVGSQGNRGDAQFVYSLYDPVTGIDKVLPNTTSVDLFCSNMSLDPVTGNVLIMGSGDFENDAVVFDYATQTIRDAEHGDMTHDRWYGQSVTMANGEIFIIGGEKTGGGGSDIPEVWNSETGWRELIDARVPGVSGDWWYPHTYVNSRNEIIILDAQGRDVFRVTTEGTGTVEQVATLPFAGDNQQVSIMISPDKVARIDNAGGLWVIDIGAETPTFEKVADTGSNRHDGGMIALPDGTVMITGGQTGGAWNRVSNADYSTLIWDPATNEINEIGEELNIARLYHSTYVMLPDGTVWIGGGGVAGAINNANFEIYAPSYLYDETGQRFVQAEIEAPSNIQAGETFLVTVDDAAAIARVTATKAGAWTHARNSDSRFLELDFSVVDRTTIAVSTPNENVMIPGAWTLYALDTNGTPSMGDIVGVNMAPLVETGNITAAAEVYGIDDDQITGAFEIKVDVRFDDLEADVRLDGRQPDSVAENAGQVVFDIGNGSEAGNRMQGSNLSGVIDYFYSDNIVLWQLGRTNDMAFSVFDGATEYRIVAKDALVEGELATWTVGVDATGMMRLWKDDVLLVEGQGVVPRNIDRKVTKVGESSWDIANDLRGMVANLEIVNEGDTPEYAHFSLPKAVLSEPRYLTDSAGEVQQTVFDLTLDAPAFAVVSADITIDGPATGPAQVVVPSGETGAQIVLDASGGAEPVTLTLSNISQARAGSTLTSSMAPNPIDLGITETTFLSDLDTLSEGGIHRGLIRDIGYYGDGITLDGVAYDKGLTMAPGRMVDSFAEFAVVPGADVFRATIGIEDAIDYAAARFDVFVDGEQVYRQFLFTNASRSYDIEIDVSGASTIRLVTDEGRSNSGAVAVWADARFEALEETHEFTGYVQGQDFTWSSGHYNTGDQVLTFDTLGQTIRFIDDDAVMDDDVNRTDRATDWTQWVEIDGERYTAYVEKIMTYSDGTDTYRFAAIDVDLNGNGRWGNEAGELYTIMAQVDGPKVALNTDLSQVSFVQIDVDYADLDVIPATDISHEFHGYIRGEDFTWVSGSYGAGTQKLSIDSRGQTIRFIDDDGILNDDVNRWDRPTDWTQWIEIGGQRYNAYVDMVSTYTDGRDTYRFASIDVDWNANGSWGNEALENYSVVAQISGPRAHMGQELDIVSIAQPLLTYSARAAAPLTEVAYLSDLPVDNVGPTHRSLGLMRDIDYFGGDIDLGGVAYDKGIMTVPTSNRPTFATFDLNGAATFKSTIGIEDWVTRNGTVTFSVEVDGEERFNSGRMTWNDAPVDVEVDVAGGSELTLVVDPVGWNNSDHPVWADARLEYAPDARLAEPGLTLYLSDLDFAVQGGIHRGLKLDQAYIDGGIDLGGVSYAKGLSTHANGRAAFVEYDINGADNFMATIGIEDWVSARGSVAFSVLVDGQPIYNSGRINWTDDPVDLDLDVSDGTTLRLEVDALGSRNADHAVWADARLTYDPASLASAQPGRIPWNGAEYELGSAGLTWDEAQAEAASKGGRVLEIGSAAENEFVFRTFGEEATSIWLDQSNADGYSNWADGVSPDNALALLSGVDGEWRGEVLDVRDSVLIVEYDIA